jgi:hypothetical protein
MSSFPTQGQTFEFIIKLAQQSGIRFSNNNDFDVWH